MSDQEKCKGEESLFEPFRKNGNESSLYIVFKALTTQYEYNQALHYIKDFCLASHSFENQRRSLEFLYASAFFDELDEMVERNKQSEELENRQWAELFEYLLKRKREQSDPYKTLKRIARLKPVSPEVEVYKTFLTIYSYYDLRETGKGSSYFNTLARQIDEVSDPLMRMYFEERVDDFWMYYHYYRNELILSRRYGFRFLQKSNNSFKKCGTHIVLALSYMLEDYEQAMYHCHEAISISDQFGYRFGQSIREKNIPFISAVNGIYEGIETSDPVENAHLAIVRGDLDQALATLQAIENPTRLQSYYLGKALQDVDLLNDAYNAFIREGHFFFAKLPLMEIRRIREGRF